MLELTKQQPPGQHHVWFSHILLSVLIDFCGELFHGWEMWLSPHSEKPVGSEVGGQDPRPANPLMGDF